jgi:threonine dehydrogenase-like Zn-dependent dehydrogenase
MQAITVIPRTAGSARLDDIAEPDPHGGSVLVETLAVGICGTDLELTEGLYGWAPPGRARLILGHESLGRVIDPGTDSTLKHGDLVAGIVRRPDPLPCPNCAVGEWDMCSNGQYTEHGIKEVDGFMAERWRIAPAQTMKIDPSLGLLGVLLEPTTVVAKAWEHVDRVGARAYWEPHTALVTGAGPIGLLAAMLGVQHGLDVHVFDRATSGPKPDAVRALGATYHTGQLADIGCAPDVVIECTGVGTLIGGCLSALVPGGILCLTGVGSGGHVPTASTADIASKVVTSNNIVMGSVNANKRHWYKAARALMRADHDWLARLITRREPPERFQSALKRTPEDIKVVIQFGTL